MKKMIVGLIFAVACGLFPASAFAAGGVSLSTSAMTIEEGETGTFTISAVNVIGDVTIVSSNVGVARVSAGEWGTGMVDEGQTKTGVITVTGVSEGSAIITLTLDAATFDGEDLAGQTRTVAVNVVRKVNGNNDDGGGSVPSGSEASSNVGVVSGGASGVGNAGSASGGNDSVGRSDQSGSAGLSNQSDSENAESGSEDKKVGEAKNGTSQNSSSKEKQGAKSQGDDKRDDSKDNKSSKGVLAWGIVAAVVVVLGAGGAVYFVKRNKRR